MEKYTYLTLSVPYGLGKKKISHRIQKVLDAKSKEGWRLIKFNISDALGVCVLIFEKEIVQDLQQEQKTDKNYPPKQETLHDSIHVEIPSDNESSEEINTNEELVK